MNICIIGAGWYGCHAATVLREKGVRVRLLDANGIFSGSSSKNQNRLHLGYHYPRSIDTVRECVSGYRKFQDRYGFCLEPLTRNLYLIHNTSKTSFDEYQNMFSNHSICSASEFTSVYPIAMNVSEKYINNTKAKEHFESTLFDVFERSPGYIDLKAYDYVLNCTNNTWVPIPIVSESSPIYETFCSLLYKINFNEPTAITVMDGPFFSIFPYDRNANIYTVTHVVHGVVSRGSSPQLESPKNIEELRQKIETEVSSVFPDFLNISEYKGYFLSGKTKYDFVYDDRSLRWFHTDNYFSFSGGKITGIFEMEKVLLETILCSKEMECSSPAISSHDMQKSAKVRSE